jgi:hypothetical protein
MAGMVAIGTVVAAGAGAVLGSVLEPAWRWALLHTMAGITARTLTITVLMITVMAVATFVVGWSTMAMAIAIGDVCEFVTDQSRWTNWPRTFCAANFSA